MKRMKCFQTKKNVPAMTNLVMQGLTLILAAVQQGAAHSKVILILVISLTVYLVALEDLVVDKQIQMHQEEALIRKPVFIFLLKKLQKAVNKQLHFSM